MSKPIIVVSGTDLLVVVVLGLFLLFPSERELAREMVSIPGGSAWEGGDCGERVNRGGSWNNIPRYLRSANRDWYDRTNRRNVIGFRLAQDE